MRNTIGQKLLEKVATKKLIGKVQLHITNFKVSTEAISLNAKSTIRLDTQVHDPYTFVHNNAYLLSKYYLSIDNIVHIVQFIHCRMSLNIIHKSITMKSCMLSALRLTICSKPWKKTFVCCWICSFSMYTKFHASLGFFSPSLWSPIHI